LNLFLQQAFSFWNALLYVQVRDFDAELFYVFFGDDAIMTCECFFGGRYIYSKLIIVRSVL